MYLNLIKEFENIDSFTMNFDNKVNYNVSKKLYEKIKNTFGHRDKKTIDNNKHEYGKLYYGLLKNLFSELGILEKKRTKDKNRKDIYKYSINYDQLNIYFKIFQNFDIININNK
jgi:hypothetical protein